MIDKEKSHMAEVFSGPSGRGSARRHAFVWVFAGGLIVAVWQGLTGGDVSSGVLALFTALITASSAAVTAGRFAERGSEKDGGPSA